MKLYFSGSKYQGNNISRLATKRGFTLVEVLVVIGIVGVLTVIIFPAVNQLRAKNRDAEKVADIATIQLALSLYHSHMGEYPRTLDSAVLVPKYLPADALITPTGDSYTYVSLKGSGSKCTYYHLGAELELFSAQIDKADNFISTAGNISNSYSYCDPAYTGPGIATGTLQYNVRP